MAQAINLEVSISPELRGLLAGRGLSALPSEPQPTVEPDRGSRSETGSVAWWTPLRLRRDGDRPVRFEGQTLVSFSTKLGLVGWDCTQEVALHVSKEQQFYLSLALLVPDGTPARPVYRCIELGADAGPDMIDDWLNLILAHAPRAVSGGETPVEDFSDLSGRFHALTARCFLPQQRPAERKNTCLQ